MKLGPDFQAEYAYLRSRWEYYAPYGFDFIVRKNFQPSGHGYQWFYLKFQEDGLYVTSNFRHPKAPAGKRMSNKLLRWLLEEFDYIRPTLFRYTDIQSVVVDTERGLLELNLPDEVFRMRLHMAANPTLVGATNDLIESFRMHGVVVRNESIGIGRQHNRAALAMLIMLSLVVLSLVLNALVVGVRSLIL